MNARRHPFPPKRRRAGFSLLEILVASGLMAILVGLVLAITTSATSAWTRAADQLTAGQQVRAAADLLQQDLEAAAPRRDRNTWLVYAENAIPDLGTVSGELRLLARPLDREAGEQGALNALAYAVAYVNPLRPAAAEGRRPGIFRGRLAAQATFDTALADLAAVPLTTFGVGLPETWLAGNVVAMRLRFGVVARKLDGTLAEVVLEATGGSAIVFPAEVTIEGEPGPVTVDAPAWVDVTFTVVADEARRLLEARADGLADGPENEPARLVERLGSEFTRRVALPAGRR